MAIRAMTVTVKDEAGHSIAELARVYGRSEHTIQDPATVFPLLALKPGAWRDCSIRPDVPDDVKGYLDKADDPTLKASLKAIARACQAAGFEPTMRAASHFIENGWTAGGRRHDAPGQTVCRRRHRLRNRPARPGCL